MTADRKKSRPRRISEANTTISRKAGRKREEAAASKISPAVPPAAAAILADVDPALDTESETGKAARRATGRDRMTGEE